MRCRRDYRDLSDTERSRFVAALMHVKAEGVVDAFADEHDTHFTHGHNNSSFLPWHREFIRRFEVELQKYDPRVMLCYWSSPTDGSTTSTLWDPSFLGQFDAAWGLGRTLGAGGSLASTSTVDGVLADGSYEVFWDELESSVHNGPHNWVGGQMATGRSPRDPVFFLHHCYIDMLWAQWQLRNAGAPFIASPGAPDVGDPMHPWSTTVGDVLDHRTINVYSYPAGYIEDAPRVTPPPSAPPSITFAAVPTGLTFLRAALFQVDSCEPLTFNIGDPVVDSGPPGTEFNRVDASIVVDPHVEPVARVWVTCTGTAAGDHATGHVDVACVETGEAWVVPIVADSVALPRAAVALVLDQSNSMNFDSGIAPNTPRAAVLRFSAPPCIDVLDSDHAVAVISFDHDPHLLRGLTVADVGGRLALNSTITGSYAPNPEGWTAIGEAVQYAHDHLDPVPGYDIKATVVLTDGAERHGPYDRRSIGDVASTINERVYAIGLGTPANIEPAALLSLCQGHEGYMLITGELNNDAYFRLAKYYQQILGGVTNQDIVLDPDGWVHAGQVIRIPFDIAETDITARAVLLTDNPQAVLFGLEAPTGDFIAPSTAHPMVEFRTGAAVEMYKVGLPLPLGRGDAHVGRWHALIGFGKRRHDGMAALGFSAASARYSLNVHALSNLNLRASLTQSSNEPGASLFLRARLSEYAAPLASHALVRAEVVHPDESVSSLTLTSVGEGSYEASMTATLEGVYRCRIVASGHTRRSRPFTREQTRTAAVWRGGDRPPAPANDPSARLCRIVRCLLKQKGLAELLRKNGVDPERVARCLSDACKHKPAAREPKAVLGALLNDDRALALVAEALRDLELETD